VPANFRPAIVASAYAAGASASRAKYLQSSECHIIFYYNAFASAPARVFRLLVARLADARKLGEARVRWASRLGHSYCKCRRAPRALTLGSGCSREMFYRRPPRMARRAYPAACRHRRLRRPRKNMSRTNSHYCSSSCCTQGAERAKFNGQTHVAESPIAAWRAPRRLQRRSAARAARHGGARSQESPRQLAHWAPHAPITPSTPDPTRH
jgi:hypothetical protein